MTVYTLEELSRIVDAFSESLNSKEDLPSNKSQSDVRQIIETYVNGTSGYRIWNDGYCEQWGYISLPSSGTVITLTKTYANTNYNLVGMYGGTVSRDQMGVCEITTSSTFTLYHSAGLNNSFCLRWKTSGYLASDQY